MSLPADSNVPGHDGPWPSHRDGKVSKFVKNTKTSMKMDRTERAGNMARVYAIHTDDVASEDFELKDMGFKQVNETLPLLGKKGLYTSVRRVGDANLADLWEVRP